MIAERDMRRAANLLIKKHGSDAALVAARSADQLLERGDMEDCTVWKRIMRAVDLVGIRPYDCPGWSFRQERRTASMISERFMSPLHEHTLRHMTRWLINLAGPEADLERLVEWPDGADWQISSHERHGVVLFGSRFEGEDNHHVVLGAAEQLIADINRSARYHAPGYCGVRRNAIVEQRDDGNHTMVVPLGLAVEVDVAESISWVKTDAEGNVVESSEAIWRKQEAEGFQQLVPLLETHPDLADALDYLADEPSMYGYYKLGEAILCALGKSHNRWNALVDLRWTTKKDLIRFRHSTQKERHHGEPGPQTPMSEQEAKAYVRGLLHKLVTHLAAKT